KSLRDKCVCDPAVQTVNTKSEVNTFFIVCFVYYCSRILTSSTSHVLPDEAVPVYLNAIYVVADLYAEISTAPDAVQVQLPAERDGASAAQVADTGALNPS